MYSSIFAVLSLDYCYHCPQSVFCLAKLHPLSDYSIICFSQTSTICPAT